MLKLLCFLNFFLKWESQVVLVVKNLPASAGDIKTYGFSPSVGKIS